MPDWIMNTKQYRTSRIDFIFEWMNQQRQRQFVKWMKQKIICFKRTAGVYLWILLIWFASISMTSSKSNWWSWTPFFFMLTSIIISHFLIFLLLGQPSAMILFGIYIYWQAWHIICAIDKNIMLHIYSRRICARERDAVHFSVCRRILFFHRNAW